MALPELASPQNMSDPYSGSTPLKSLQDLTIIEARDPGASASKYITFYLVTPNEELYFGQSFKKKKDMTFEDYGAALQRGAEYENAEEFERRRRTQRTTNLPRGPRGHPVDNRAGSPG